MAFTLIRIFLLYFGHTQQPYQELVVEVYLGLWYLQLGSGLYGNFGRRCLDGLGVFDAVDGSGSLHGFSMKGSLLFEL